MPGDQPSRAQWSAAPPPLPAGASGSARPSPPGRLRPRWQLRLRPHRRAASRGRAARARLAPRAPAQAPVVVRPSAAPLFAEPFYESDVAPTLPTAQVPSSRPVEEEPPPRLSRPSRRPRFLRRSRWRRRDRVRGGDGPGGSDHPAPRLVDARGALLRQGLADGRSTSTGRSSPRSPATTRSASAWRRSRQAAGEPAGSREARRRALEQTIAGLEALLAAVRRR